MGQSIKGRSIRHLHVLFRDVICQGDGKNDTASSDDSVLSEYINNMDQMIEDLKRQIEVNEQQIKMHKQQVAASIQ